jgi:S1-C subfamily serine protease
VLFSVVTLLFLLVFGNASTAKVDSEGDLTSAVLRVEANIVPPDWSAPWKVPAPQLVSGTAFAIAGGRLLTNAHVVEYAQQVTVKKNDGSAPVIATIEAVDESCDLAVLRVANQSFFNNVHPLALGPLPNAGSSVTIYGYPMGGRELSTTTGVVSRIEMHYYSEGLTSHLAGQTDAAINPGNSGGPVVQGKLVVGVAFQVLRSGQNIGYFIPSPVVRHFLDDLSDGTYEGFPDAPLVLQTIESPALRRERGLPDDRSGVVVEAIPKGSSFQGLLAPGDVLLAIGGERISDDGTFASGATRLPLDHLFDMKQVGQAVPLRIWRDGKDVEVTWKADKYAVWDRLRRRGTPRYLVFGGLVFVPLSYRLLHAPNMPAERRAAMLRAIHSQMFGPGGGDDREIVLLAAVLPDAINEGLQDATRVVVEKLNGQPIRSLATLAQMLDTNQSPHDVFALGPYDTMAVLDHKAAAAGSAALLHAHGISHDRNL